VLAHDHARQFQLDLDIFLGDTHDVLLVIN
jgi:hypothetical protein